MKSNLSIIFLAGLLLSGATLWAQIPAFPGAEGFGAYANGGRGGDVYTVVNLNSSGAGSLRYGIENASSNGRTIVFAVSGYIPINYNSDTGNQTVRIVQNNVTIAGQTAPGDGIGLKDGRILVTGNNVVLRHLRIRHGKYGGAGDCLNLESSADDSIIDHLSLMFSTDENISFFNSSLDNFTMQYSTSSWGMERHNAGGLWDLQDGSCHHSLWAHHRTRNPKARPNGLLEWINNVTFHWRSEGFIMGDSETPANWRANVRGCYFLSIADYEFGLKNTALSKARIASDGQPNFHLYLDNCLHDADGNGLLNGTDKGYAIVDGQPYDPLEGAPAGTVRYDKSATPFAGAPVAISIDDPLTAYKKVLSSAGALRLDATYTGPLRDELDDLLIDSVENQQSILVAKDTPVTTDPEEPPSNGELLLAQLYGITNSGFGTLNSAAAPTDMDGDGMPDDWELALGSNTDTQDHNTAFANNGSIITASTFFPPSTPAGYTYLEEYLHFCAIPHGKLEKNTAAQPASLTVDLSRYTRGFTNSPAFTISGSYGGTIQQFAADGTTPSSNGPVVLFTPTQDFYGRAGFHFNVSDADSSSWTQQFAILVTTDFVDNGPPATPEKLSAVGGDSVVWLNWHDNTEPDLAGYNVKRSLNESGPYTVIATDLTVPTYTDTPLTNGITYYYVVTAVDTDSSESAYSNEATATPTTGPDVTAPGAPTGLTAVSGVSQIVLDWDDNTEADLNGYNIWRSTTSGGPYNTAASAVATSDYTDSSVTYGSTYYYVVTAVDTSSNESNISNEAAGTPQAQTYAVNCGGGDENPFTADAYYSAGGTYTKVNTIDRSGLINPAPEAVYQCERHGNFNYTFPGLIAGANYTVRLHFAEIYFSAVGSRIFNVAINGSAVLTNYDIFAVTGARYKAYIEEFAIQGDANGQIVAAFTSVVDNSLICGIEVLFNGIPDPTGGQAEAALYGNGAVFEKTNTGFNGTGYINFPTSGGYLEFTDINGGAGGDASLDIRYALGAAGTRTGNLIVNGTSQSITFDSTSAWTTWAVKNLTVTLNSGTNNTIRFESNGQDLANIDQITVRYFNNSAPVFTSDPINNLDAIELEIYAGQSLAMYANDVDGMNTVMFSKVSGPNWLAVANDGTLSGFPVNADVGANTFTVRVVDTGGLSDTATMNITVANIYSGVAGLDDILGLASQWLMEACTDVPACDGADLDGDQDVDLDDFAQLAFNWQAVEGIELYLKLDETHGIIAHDSSLYARSGILTNGPAWSTSGHTAGALTFDGADDYVIVSDYKGITGTVWRTCSAWIKTGGSSANMVIMDWGTAAAGQKWLFGIFTTGKLTVYTWSPYIQTDVTVTDNQWHHVAAVLVDDGTPDVSEIQLYVDGLPQSVTVSSAQAINTAVASDVLIGAFDDAGTKGGYFNGLMDEVQIYNRALTAAEIAAQAQ
jgi:hypothetical protein